MDQAQRFEVRVERDIVYGTGKVTRDGVLVERELKLDRYAPVGPAGAKPAIVMAFGGAFHRGSKENDAFPAEGNRNTAIAEYCRRFAACGYVCFSIDYRMVPEDPDPGDTPVITSDAGAPLSRVDVVRRMLGLPPATVAMMRRGIEAACDDMVNAVRHVIAQAAAYEVDPRRIALAGFSAGARTALNAAYAEKLPVKAVVSISGFMAADDLARHVVPGGPRAMLVWGERDLDYIVPHSLAMAEHFRRAGLLHAAYQVTGANHFYPAESPIKEADGTQTTVEGAMARFLAGALA
ncbi:MAG: alpha/beta hydrolase [Burkholderiales bacterium]